MRRGVISESLIYNNYWLTWNFYIKHLRMHVIQKVPEFHTAKWDYNFFRKKNNTPCFDKLIIVVLILTIQPARQNMCLDLIYMSNSVVLWQSAWLPTR